MQSLIFAILAEVTTSTSASILIGIIVAATPIITLYINNKFKKNQKKLDMREKYIASNFEEISRQKEFLARENKELWSALKEELEECRTMRQELEVFTIDLKEKIIRIEEELGSWKLGLKVPEGFVLIKEDIFEEIVIEDLEQD